MLWLKEHRHYFQAIALLLFCVAILGPWGISDDGVPPADWCSEPYILLRADRCVRLMPGIEILGIGWCSSSFDYSIGWVVEGFKHDLGHLAVRRIGCSDVHAEPHLPPV